MGTLTPLVELLVAGRKQGRVALLVLAEGGSLRRSVGSSRGCCVFVGEESSTGAGRLSQCVGSATGRWRCHDQSSMGLARPP
jgi:hypothetical protein